MDACSLYDAVIVARSRSPQYSGAAKAETARAQGTNPLCGDRVRLSLCEERDGIRDLRHETRGCAICIASTDLMAETVTGRTKADALELARRFTDMLNSQSSSADLDGEAGLPGVLQAFLPLRTHRSRLRCATLPWTALGEALKHD